MVKQIEGKLRVIDFFCGAGGFSEGFRQQGFEIIMGIDCWKPAVLTHNINHNLSDTTTDILKFENIEEIEKLPNSEVIVGSPPCISFSLSNKGGNADKSTGLRLIEAYLRVVAVKKHQKNSILKAWLMENVPNSRNYVKEEYTFEDLNLTEWAVQNNFKPTKCALKVKDTGDVLLASDYGSSQSRKRFVCGEITKTGKFPFPDKIKTDTTLRKILTALPAPLEKKPGDFINDPNYSSLKIKSQNLTDHFYDTGVYEIEWRRAQEAKTNHPYMGKMSIPENLDKPSRTIMATRSASTRESILYKSELHRKGDGEYRLPTVREAASAMGFPLTYVFTGNESTKWRLIGNAVCPQLSASIAKSINKSLGLSKTNKVDFMLPKNYRELTFLDDYKIKDFKNPPKRNPNALFRSHPVKTGNMTVALTNKHPTTLEKDWAVFAFTGTGKGYKITKIKANHFKVAESIIKKHYPEFLDKILNDEDIKKLTNLQLDSLNSSHYYSKNGHLNHPLGLVNRIKNFIDDSIGKGEDIVVDTTNTVLDEIKNQIPISQIMSLYGLKLIH